ncbi:hypothetical protein CYMTET_57085 [Cymbomonas tetramitiformis]|uniref:Gamma-glutamyltransferase n=1 Tax=Cymbomonas tetramitiformis TaxID=36881 RepID=A0AAE0ELB7_9CHLO|nr:hypothetical protein CYMTET_57085 [Cymbomonas tetramitiformis]
MGTSQGPTKFNSRRSPALGTNGMVASSQPLASEAGLRILRQGGNAADAAVAMAAALNVTEPTSTGIGGDAFALLFDGEEVQCIMGSGKSPAGMNLDVVRSRGYGDGVPLPFYDALTVTVPGAAAAWHDIVARHGRLSLAEVLAPAIELAENGFPVGPITAHLWEGGLPQLKGGGPHAVDLMKDGTRAPRAGEIMRNPNLANTFRQLVEQGKDGFYKGAIAEAIVEALQAAGSVMTLEDLAGHTTHFEPPICTTYRGMEVWEVPPPTQGITALMALSNLEAAIARDGKGVPEFHSTAHLHDSIECMRLAFSDALQHVADPRLATVPTSTLLSKEYAAKRCEMLDPSKAVAVEAGRPDTGADTVYFCVVDGDGMGCSMINSNYMGFGTGIVPRGCGFTLQNRGHNFSLDPKHPNCVGPSKRPYHTIIPGLCTYPSKGAGEKRVLANCFGVMGGFMQPQGHMQVINNMLDYSMDPQAALDAPRFCVEGVGDTASAEDVARSKVLVEEGISEEVKAELEGMGHTITGPLTGYSRQVFGRGQIIKRDPETGTLWGGSDPRADGLAIGW